MDQASTAADQEYLELGTTNTTLYELIDAISEQVQPGEDGLVAEVVLHLLETGRIKFLDFE